MIDLGRNYAISLGAPPSSTVGQEIELAKLAEDLGFRGVSVTERNYDGHIMLTAIGLATHTVNVLSSSGIHYRSPTMAAMDAAMIDELTGGRLLIGLVAGSPMATAPFGLRFEGERILTKMKEYVEVIRRLIAGDRVTYSGSVYKIKDAQLWFKAPRSRIPILIGATGPRMCRLAGEIADGVMIRGLQPANYVKQCIDNILLGASHASRDRSKLDLSAAVFYFDSEDDARRFTVWWMGRERAYDDVWAHAGLTPTVEMIRAYYREGNPGKALELIDTNVLRTFSMWGTKDDCADLLDDLWSLGLSRIMIVPKGKASLNGPAGSHESTKQTIRRVASVVSQD